MIGRCPHCGEELEVHFYSTKSAKFDHAQAIGLMRAGATQSEVAEAFGVSRQAVSAMLKRRGLVIAKVIP